MTSIQGDEMWLLVGSGIGFQTASKMSLVMTVYKIKCTIEVTSNVVA